MGSRASVRGGSEEGGATRCPACGRALVAERTGRGEALPGAGKPIFVAGGRCPYPACGVPLYSWSCSPSSEPEFLATSAALRALRRRCAARELAGALPGVAIVITVVLFALWAGLRGVAEAGSPCVLALVIGGPLMVLAAACGFVGLAVSCQPPAPAADEPCDAGLRIAPERRTYRDG